MRSIAEAEVWFEPAVPKMIHGLLRAESARWWVGVKSLGMQAPDFFFFFMLLIVPNAAACVCVCVLVFRDEKLPSPACQQPLRQKNPQREGPIL